jgi:hypothetical protein
MKLKVTMQTKVQNDGFLEDVRKTEIVEYETNKDLIDFLLIQQHKNPTAWFCFSADLGVKVLSSHKPHQMDDSSID